MDISDAPAQTISRIATQNSGFLNSCPMVIPLPSSVRCSIGHVAKLKMLYSGISAHAQARIRQLPMPKAVKKSEDRRITPTDPQQ